MCSRALEHELKLVIAQIDLMATVGGNDDDDSGDYSSISGDGAA